VSKWPVEPGKQLTGKARGVAGELELPLDALQVVFCLVEETVEFYEATKTSQYLKAERHNEDRSTEEVLW